MLEAVDQECAAIREEGRKATDARSRASAAEGDRADTRPAQPRWKQRSPWTSCARGLGFIQDTVRRGGCGRSSKASAWTTSRAGPRARCCRKPAGACLRGARSRVRRAGMERCSARGHRRDAPSRAAIIEALSALTGGRGAVEIERPTAARGSGATAEELEAELLEERREELAVAPSAARRWRRERERREGRPHQRPHRAGRGARRERPLRRGRDRREEA